MADNKWFPGLRRRASARLQLFCFPFAGGGASAFRGWQDELPTWVEVWPLEYPGRETRFRDPAYADCESLAAAICVELTSAIDRPFALFGHSMGALLAFETARGLRRLGGPKPVELFVSGRSAPQLPPFRPPVRNLPEREFREELRHYGGTPDEVLANDELMEILSPLLRTDLGVCETYGYFPEPELDFPITAFGGTEDRTVPWHGLFEWSHQSTAFFSAYVLPGDHFFVRQAAPLVRKLLTEHLERNGKSKPIRVPAAQEVHLWRFDLEVPDTLVRWARSLLSSDELQRADAFLQDADRSRYTITRAALRTLLGQYGNLPPDKIQFTYLPRGKPQCQMLLPLDFNVAHSGKYALIAIGREQAIGVDVERIRKDLDVLEVGKQVCTQTELTELAQCSTDKQTNAFFDLWVRKEAYLKCTGDGFLGAPEKTYLGLQPPVGFAWGDGRASAGGQGLPVQSFSPAEGYAAALSAEKGLDWIRFFDGQENCLF